MYPIVLDSFLPNNLLLGLIDELLQPSWFLNNADGKLEKNKFYTPKRSFTLREANALPFFNCSVYIKLKFRKRVPSLGELMRWHVNGQVFGQESNFHIDNGTDLFNAFTVVIFTSPCWSTHWGGEFCLFDPELNDYSYVPYKPNRAVLFPSHFEHCGRAPNCNTDEMRTSVAFVYSIR